MQLYADIVRLWWNWQTRYFEVVVEQSVQVQVLLTAPFQFHSPSKRISPFTVIQIINLFRIQETRANAG